MSALGSQSGVKNVMKRYFQRAELDEYLRTVLADAGFAGVDMQHSPLGARVTIYTARPGLVIGRRGIGIKSLTEEVEKKFLLKNVQLSVSEVESPELNPTVVCQGIARMVSRGTAFRRAGNVAINAIMSAGALGAEISISGKLRSERSRHEKYRAGVVPKTGDVVARAVKEATTHVLLKMGLYGIKVKIAVPHSLPADVELKEGKLEQQKLSAEGEGTAKAEG